MLDYVSNNVINRIFAVDSLISLENIFRVYVSVCDKVFFSSADWAVRISYM